MGLVYASELTYVAAIAAMAVARMFSEGTSRINPKDCYNILGELKAMVRQLKCHFKLPHYGQIRTFPAGPSELMEQHPNVYELMYQGAGARPDLGLAQCPLDPALLQHVRAMLPARKTHTSVNLNMQLANSLLRVYPSPPKRPYSIAIEDGGVAKGGSHKVGRTEFAIEDGDVHETLPPSRQQKMISP